MLSVKCGREEFELNSNDIIMYNGSCYQITTRESRNGWNSETPKISNAKAEKLIKAGKLVFSHKEKKMIEVSIFKIAK